MKVSIVVPTFNQGKYIKECLESIYTQKYRDIEVIIQDSLSNDGTEAICDKYTQMDPRFRYCREKDLGQSDAINRGLAKCSGKLWTWICSDDRYNNSQAIAKLVDAFKRGCASDAGAVGAFGRACFMDEDGKITGPYPQMNTHIEREDLQMDWPLSQPSSILLRQRVLDVGGVVTEFHLAMDLDLFIKMLEGGRRLVYLDHPVADVRVQPHSKSVKQHIATAVTAMYIVQEHFGSIGNPSKSAYAKQLHYAFDKDSEEVAHLKAVLRESEADRAARLEQILMFKEMLEQSEADRAARLELILMFKGMLEQSEADRAARLEQILMFKEMLEQSEADRALRGEQIEILTKHLRESEADRAARLEQILMFKEMLEQSEADRAARLEHIHRLTAMVQESEHDRALRGEQIEILTKRLREKETRLDFLCEQIGVLTCAFEGLRSSRLYWLLSMSSFIKCFERVLPKIQSKDSDPSTTIS
jgi:hypothetical protein